MNDLLQQRVDFVEENISILRDDTDDIVTLEILKQTLVACLNECEKRIGIATIYSDLNK